MGVYAFDMMYACEGPHYRVLQVTVAQLALTGQVQVLTLLDEDGVAALDPSLVGPPDGDALIGGDLQVQFANAAIEAEFDKAVGRSPICYLYYLEGRYLGRQRFLVEDYRLTENVPACIGEPAADSEQP